MAVVTAMVEKSPNAHRHLPSDLSGNAFEQRTSSSLAWP